MNARIIALILSCISLPACSSSEMPVQAASEDAAMDFSTVVNELPWKFKLSSTVIDDEQQNAASTRYDYVSIEPLKKTSQGNVYLKVDLAVMEYNTAELASEELMGIKEKAHPDMGLSYAWDYLLLQGRSLYHLHTGCVVSEDNFDIMVSNLRKVVLQQGNDKAQALRCRCGGGCRVAE